MASCNFIGLVKTYGEYVLQYIKACEFHFCDSVNRHANKFGDESETFKKYARQLLTSSTPEAHEISCQQLKSFINTTTNTETCNHCDITIRQKSSNFVHLPLKKAPPAIWQRISMLDGNMERRWALD